MSERRTTVFDGASRQRPRPASGGGLDRRRALELLAAGLTAGLAACSSPDEEIVPYVNMPERLVPGMPLRFASTLPLSGYGRGVVCTSFEGRPTKVEGNPRHPASQGSTDPFAEAAVLQLYDPDRSRTVRLQTEVSSWEAFVGATLAQLQGHADDGGAGLRLLTGRVTSPTLARQIGEIQAKFPQARWHRYEPVDDDNARRGARLAYGRTLTVLPDLGRADVILALDADPLGVGPDQIRNARGFAERRTVRRDGTSVSRLYAVEPLMTLTGANADNRLALAPHAVGDLAVAVAVALGAGVDRPELAPVAARFADAVARDLQQHQGRALVLVGHGQPPEVHALGHWINAKLQAPVTLIEPLDPVQEEHADSLAALLNDMRSGAVRTLVMLECNPAYETPAELGFADALRRVPFSVHLGLHVDETAVLSRWHLPATHPLESWSDLRAVDGTASIVQPLIRPLYDTRTAHELLPLLLGQTAASAHDLVRDTWRPQAGADFEAWWRQALHDGVVPGTAAPAVQAPEPRLPDLGQRPPAPGGMTVLFRPDPTVWDGRFANNAWLQECPKPLTKQVWSNAAHVAPEDAKRLGLTDGDLLNLERGSELVVAPVIVQHGQASGTVGLTLGYGRTHAGTIGSGLGANAYKLRPAASPWAATDVAVSPAHARSEIVRTQLHFDLEDEERHKQILPQLKLADLARASQELPSESPPPSLYPPFEYPRHAWAMVIDTTLCIGCNTCVLACQAENNIPVVGPVEVSRGRLMHWMRIDTYELGSDEDPRPGFQPVPCMHCEQAPCEPVCPVEASVHDHEGLNVQVYNRCIGTRFCESNCPYKVRRFNFFAYNNGQEFANMGEEPVLAQHNPEVTVRARGVMEKCTYCVQRISWARRQAETENREIGADEVVPACAAACPTRAIAFGDLDNPDSSVNRLRKEPQHYAMLEHLGTRPRTTYLALLRNPNPDLEEGAS